MAGYKPTLQRLFSPALGYNSNWCAEKSIFGPNLIFEITQVSEVHEFRVIDIDHEGRWVGTDLGAVKHFQLSPGMRWMWMLVLRFMNDFVNPGGCQPRQALLLHAQRHR